MSETKKPGLIRRFFTGIWGMVTFVRGMLANIFFLLMLVVMFVVYGSYEPFTMPDKAALVVAPTGVVVDQRSFIDPLTRLVDPSALQSETPLRGLITTIKEASKDKRITMMVLRLDEMQAIGMSKTYELALEIQAFKAAGKKVVAYGNNFNQQTYMLASFADEIYVHPMGGVVLTGFAVYRNYFKDALDKLKVDFHVFRVGQFKSALEPILRNDMSEQAKEANNHWLQAIWQQYTSTVIANRDLPEQSIDHYINNIDQIMTTVSGNAALAALEYGLVDGIKTKDEMVRYLTEQVGEDEDGYYSRVDNRHYLNIVDFPFTPEVVDKNGIGIVVAEGMIIDGNEPPGVAAGESVATLLRKARRDDNIRAVVLRVSSGGGSAFASEVIREQVVALQQAGKPVVVSMGAMAASGGYWVAAGADEIWASPVTLTGSIGIYGAFPTVNRSLAEMGIYSDGVGTTRLAGAYAIDRPLNAVAAAAIQSGIEYGYSRFIQIVAEGRGMAIEDVEKLAQGRVWTGKDAFDAGLVDHLGGLSAAVESAAKLVNLENDYQVLWVEDEEWAQMSALDALLGNISARLMAKLPLLAQLQAGLPPLLSQPHLYNDPKHTYLHCAECVIH
ncbi:MAG: signal peptide peptidase SppA [Pseudomonadales bacterium]